MQETGESQGGWEEKERLFWQIKELTKGTRQKRIA